MAVRPSSASTRWPITSCIASTLPPNVRIRDWVAVGRVGVSVARGIGRKGEKAGRVTGVGR